ncbi:MAG TPA: hypothetical protein VFL99_14115 [Segeticoccus sp.]|uniref:hypothetical protein n=1 Tax=Segeticoccus sp. TaxID=2706531 RepID=UPI002D809D14|nr:hypothetical protein [Segeticoccus sp.]HET8601460.1 hypothetical protein [Segeticoccus sp.]
MLIDAVGVAVDGPHAPLLLPTSLTARTGAVTLAVGDHGDAHVALALVLGGQLEPDAGRVTFGGSADPALRRRHAALVDVPGVTAPDPGVSVHDVVGEELALAHQPARRRHVRAVLEAQGLNGLAGARWESVPAEARTRVLTELAARRATVDLMVLAHPDRFGGRPDRWWRLAQDLAEQGLAVVVQCSHASARLLGAHDYAQLGVAA